VSTWALGREAARAGTAERAGARADLLAARPSALARRSARSATAAWRNQAKSTTSAATTSSTLHQGRTETAANAGTTTTSDNNARRDRPRTRRANGPRLASEVRFGLAAAVGRAWTWGVGGWARFTTTSAREGRAGLTEYERGVGSDRSDSGNGVRRSSTRIASENRSTDRAVARCSRRPTQCWSK